MIFRSKGKLQRELQDRYGKPKGEYFSFSKIEHFFVHKAKSKDSQLISDQTCRDLDFEELFMFVDRTTSRVGQQYLYATLRTIDFSQNAREPLVKLTQLFEEDQSLRETVAIQLARLSHEGAYYLPSLFLKAHVQPPTWFWVIKVLSISSLCLLVLLPFYPKLLLLLLAVLIANYGIHYWNKRNVFSYMASIPPLLRLKEVAKELMKQEKLQEHSKEVTKATRTLDKVSSSLSFLALEAKLEGELGALVQVVTELFKALFLLEPLLLFAGLKQLEKKGVEIARVFEFVGLIDTAISIGNLRAGLAYYCHPTLSKDGKKMSAKDLYHPLIVEPVANSFSLVDKSMLLTGSNMSGKTTFIRTIAINAILAQTLDTCLAKEFILPPMRVFSAMRISDDLLSDKSYYFEEIHTIKAMIDESQGEPQALFLLDELFKGTNTVERIAAGKAVLSYLTKRQHLVFVSTHDIELTAYLKDRFDLYHFSEVVKNDQIAFDYKLKEGTLKTRNAIRILELNAYPQEVIQEAKALAQGLTNSVMDIN